MLFRSDAMAGLLILIINVVGGLAIGVAQHSMSFSDAGKLYTLLTIGDGLSALAAQRHAAPLLAGVAAAAAA